MGIGNRDMNTSQDKHALSRIAKPLSFRANFSWTFLGNAVYAGCQWGMLMVLAKLGTPEMVGQFSLGLAVTAPVFGFARLQLRTVQATDATREYDFGDYLALRILCIVLAISVTTAIIVLSGYGVETALIIFAIGFAKALENMSDVYYGFFQQRERMDCTAKSLLIKGPISLFALTMGVWLSGGVFWGVVSMAVMWGLLLILYDMRNAILIREKAVDLYPRWHLPTLARLARLAFPLGIVTTLLSLNTNIPRYTIQDHWGVAALGVYSAMDYLMVAGNTVIQALGQSASPRLSQYYATGNRIAFQKLLIRLVGFGVMVGISAILAALVAGREILTLIYTPEYATQNHVFVLLMISACLSYMASLLGYGMTAARHFRAQVPLFAIVVVTTALASHWLIPQYGLQGAAFALIASLVVYVLGSASIVFHALVQNSFVQR